MSATAEEFGRGHGGVARSGRRDGGRATRAVVGAGSPVLILVFLLSLALPFNFYAGPLRLTPYRVMLLVMIIPLFMQWMAGRMGGKPILPDMLFLGYAVWIPFSLLVTHGFERLPFGGITAVEAFGAYLLGRSLVRGPEAFEYFVRCLILILLALIPLVAYEALTGHRPLSAFLRGDEAFTGMAHGEMRWGMHRAQGPFEHPILFGVFAASGFGMAWFAFSARGGQSARLFCTGVAGVATFFSLSMGAFLAGFVQTGMMGYELITRRQPNRWKILLMVSLGIYLFFYVFSHRGITGIVVEELSFNAFAASVRLHAWQYGFDAALGNPLFGIGFGDWARPGWLTSSVDNFWLLNAMRYGLPAAVMLIAGIVILIRRVARAEAPDAMFSACRLGFVTAILGMSVALASVHAWNALYSYLFFLLGAGAWMALPAEEATGRRGQRKGGAPAEAQAGPEAAPRSIKAQPPRGGETFTKPVLRRGPVRPPRLGKR